MSVPPPAGKHKRFDPPPGPPMPPAMSSENNAARVRVHKGWVIGGAVVLGIIVADAVAGLLGHIIALAVWLAPGAWLVLRGPVRASEPSKARTWARIEAGVCVLGVIASASLPLKSGNSNTGSTGVGSTYWYSQGYNYAVNNIDTDPGPYTYAGTTAFDMCAAAMFPNPNQGTPLVSPVPRPGLQTQEWAAGCESGANSAAGG